MAGSVGRDAGRLAEFLLESQARFLRCGARFKGFSGPVGSGKSEALVMQAIASSLLNPGCAGLLGAPTFQMLRDATLNRLLERLEMLGIGFEYERSKQVITLWNGSQMILRPLEDFERLRGMNLAWFGLDELTYVPEESWLRLEARLREPAAKKLCGFGVWTPKGYDWVWKRFVSGEYSGYKTVHAKPFENRFLLDHVPDYYERLRSSYSPEFYKQEALGEYCAAASNRVYAGFDRRLNVAPVVRESGWELLWSLDFNVNPMSSVVAQRCGRELQVLDEVVLRNASTQDAVREFVRRWGDETCELRIYGDASGYQRQRTGPSDWDAVMAGVKFGRFAKVRLRAPSVNPAVEARIRLVNGKLLNAGEERELTVDPRCEALIRDLEEVTYGADGKSIHKTGNAQLSHISDALGYLIWGEYADEGPRGFQRSRLF